MEIEHTRRGIHLKIDCYQPNFKEGRLQDDFTRK